MIFDNFTAVLFFSSLANVYYLLSIVCLVLLSCCHFLGLRKPLFATENSSELIINSCIGRLLLPPIACLCFANYCSRTILWLLAQIDERFTCQKSRHYKLHISQVLNVHLSTHVNAQSSVVDINNVTSPLYSLNNEAILIQYNFKIVKYYSLFSKSSSKISLVRYKCVTYRWSSS